MSNMSYCRFENTNADLADCLDALLEMTENKRKEDKLGREELRAAKALAAKCLEIIDVLIEHAGKDIDDVEAIHLEEAIESINDECVETDDEDEDDEE